MIRCKYRYAKVLPQMVWIIDLNDGAMSVTNDAEAVCLQVYADLGDVRIIYRDSAGNWDELVHADGRFVGFNPGGAYALPDRAEHWPPG